jgi:hypothetical protein
MRAPKGGLQQRMIALLPDARPRSLTGRYARKEERFRELVAWHMLQNMDEATARRRAQEEMDDGPRKDRPRMGGTLRVRTGERK